MRLYRHLCVALIAATIFVNHGVNAAAVPSYNGRMNNAVSSIVQAKAVKQGFAVNDPKYAATISALSVGATAVVTGIAGGAVATVGWPALLVGAGISALVSGAVSLGVDSLVSWLWGDASHTQQVQLSGSGMGGGDLSLYATVPSTWPAVLQLYGAPADIWFKDTVGTKARHVRTVQVTCPGAGSQFCGAGTAVSTSALDYTFSSAYGGPFPGTNGYYSNVYRIQTGSTTSPATATYQIVYDFLPPSSVTLLPPSYTPTWKSAPEAVQDLPSAYTAQPLSDKMLADVANTVWKNAAANGAQTIPWSASDPITPSDIAAWRAANPGLVPTVGDFISPVGSPADSSVPFPITGQGTSGPSVPGTSTPPVTLDLGPDPQNGPPTLAATPTAHQILDPILNLMPDLRGFAVPSHSAACPKPSFSVFGNSYVISTHCDLFENNRASIEAIMFLVWTIAATIIVLRA